jgi:hypothetical protein
MSTPSYTFSMNALIRDIHIFSAMLVLLLMLFFAVSGFFLAHPDLSRGDSPTTQLTITSPAWLDNASQWDEKYTQHGLRLLLWLDKNHDVRGVDFEFEWDDMDNLLIVSLQSPGGNTLVEYFASEQRIVVEQSPFSFLDMLNNVHRAKHTSILWKYMSDVSAIVMVLFCLSGLWLALIHKHTRKASSQWLIAGSGAFVLVLYLMH